MSLTIAVVILLASSSSPAYSRTALMDWDRCIGDKLLVHSGTAAREAVPRLPDYRDRERYEPAVITEGMTPVKPLAGFTVDGKPILYVTADGSQAVVDERVFPHGLSFASTSRMKAGESVPLGSVVPEALQAVTPQQLVRFLILSEVIETRIHVEAELCMTAESGDHSGYSATWEGTHTYYTNEQNVVPLAFTVSIDAQGNIRLRR